MHHNWNAGQRRILALCRAAASGRPRISWTQFVQTRPAKFRARNALIGAPFINGQCAGAGGRDKLIERGQSSTGFTSTRDWPKWWCTMRWSWMRCDDAEWIV